MKVSGRQFECQPLPEPDPDPVACPLCGRLARFRGRRNRLGVFECVDDACMVTIFEVHDPVLAERPGGR
jgi:hypothetical protein